MGTVWDKTLYLHWAHNTVAINYVEHSLNFRITWFFFKGKRCCFIFQDTDYMLYLALRLIQTAHFDKIRKRTYLRLIDLIYKALQINILWINLHSSICLGRIFGHIIIVQRGCCIQWGECLSIFYMIKSYLNLSSYFLAIIVILRLYIHLLL